MKKVVVALAALALAAPAFAQQQPQATSDHRAQIGVGVSITEVSALVASPTIEVYLPIQVGPNIRIEPSLGLFTDDQPTGGTDTKNITLGVGVFVQQKVAPPVDLYVGGRLKLNFASADTGAADDSGTDFTLAAAIGGEYYLVPKFSIGLEGQLGFYSNAQVNGRAGGDNSGFFTTGLGFLRVYF